MNDNVIAYILSLVCIIFILIEIVSVNKKKGMADLIVFFYYSCPLYYFMLYRGMVEQHLLGGFICCYLHSFIW